MAPAILTCPVAAIGATGKVTDPGMSEAISGSQQRQEVLLMTENPANMQESCHTDPRKPLTASHLTGPVLGSLTSVFHLSAVLPTECSNQWLSRMRAALQQLRARRLSR